MREDEIERYCINHEGDGMVPIDLGAFCFHHEVKDLIDAKNARIAELEAQLAAAPVAAPKIDIARMQSALASESIDMPPGLSKDEMRQVILGHAAQEPVYCGCGDQIMPDDGARCGTCVAVKYQPAQGECQPAFQYYCDEDEYSAEDMPHYLKERIEHTSINEDAWGIGYEFHVDAVYSRREKWRVVNDVTFKAERIE